MELHFRLGVILYPSREGDQGRHGHIVAFQRNINSIMDCTILVFVIADLTLLGYADQQATAHDREPYLCGLFGDLRFPLLAIG